MCREGVGGKGLAHLSKPAVPLLRPAGRDGNELHELGLTVHVLSASVSNDHASSGVLSRPCAILEASLAGETWNIESADFTPPSGSESKTRKPNSSGQDGCGVWRFSADALSFKISLDDLVGPGLCLRLRARSDVALGPLTLQVSSAEDIGEAVVDLWRCVLPACAGRRKQGARGGFVWESPAMMIPCVCSHEPGTEAMSHVTLVFSTREDPARFLSNGEQGSPPREHKASKEHQQSQWWELPLEAAVAAVGGCGLVSVAEKGECGCWSSHCARHEEEKRRGARSAFVERNVGNLPPRPALKPASGPVRPIKAPDQASDGWLCRRGPGGRTFWHHVDLGPAPWDLTPQLFQDAANQGNQGNQAFARSLMGNGVADRLRREEERSARGAGDQSDRLKNSRSHGAIRESARPLPNSRSHGAIQESFRPMPETQKQQGERPRPPRNQYAPLDQAAQPLSDFERYVKFGS